MLEQYDTLINRASASYGVPVAWLKAWIMTESSGNPKAYRAEPKINDASYGLGQILLKTAKGLGYTGTAEGLYDPETNINLMAKFIAQLRTRFGDDVKAVYSAYNSGSSTLYTTSAQVAQHVNNLLRNLENSMKSEPFILSMGTLGAGLTVLAIWYWTKKG